MNISRTNADGLTPIVGLLSVMGEYVNHIHREALGLYIFENVNLREAARLLELNAGRLIYDTRKEGTWPFQFSDCKGMEYIYTLDAKEHGLTGHNGTSFALNFVVPLLIEIREWCRALRE